MNATRIGTDKSEQPSDGRLMGRRQTLGWLLAAGIALAWAPVAALVRAWRENGERQAQATTLHVHTGIAPGLGHAGWTVRAYRAGSEVEQAVGITDKNGDARLSLAAGEYEYSVERGGLASARRPLLVAQGPQTLNHRLFSVQFSVLDRNKQPQTGVRVHLYPAHHGRRSALWSGRTDAEALIRAVLPDGRYSLVTETEGAGRRTVNVDLIYRAPMA